MPTQEKYLSLQDASVLSGKSLQTIRRAIKSKKISVRRKKTPQGFHYLIDRESFSTFYKIGKKSVKKNVNPEPQQIPFEGMDHATPEILTHDEMVDAKKLLNNKDLAEEIEHYLTKDHLKEFQKNIQRLAVQQQKERENFMRLIQSFQERINVLEQQVRLLETPKKHWYQFWK